MKERRLWGREKAGGDRNRDWDWDWGNRDCLLWVIAGRGGMAIVCG